MAKVTIIGLGLIGGSLGKALRQAGGGFEVVGHDRDAEVAGRAKRKGAVDRAEWNLPKAVEGASLVIIATPAAAVESVFNDIRPYLSPGCVVTDTASTKVDVLDWAKRILPAEVSFVGGNPMVGKERSGIDEADAALFRDGTYCVVPAPGARDEAVSLVVGMVNAVGAKPLFIDPVEHDSYVAAISHVPYLAAAALVKVAAGSAAWRDIAKVAAWGFRDTTKLASGDTIGYRDVCLTNRKAILHWLDAYLAELGALREAVASGDRQTLEDALGGAKKARDAWEQGRGPEEAPSVLQEMGTAGQFRQMLLGGWAGRPEKKR
mgnify:CR=1 FL=1